jgi:uncharacterized protein
MVYLDTSFVVAALTNEANSAAAQQWLEQQQPETLCISDWVMTEVSSALAIKLRAGQIESDERADALAAFSRLCIETFNIEPVSRRHFRLAADLVNQTAFLLRAADALHLAICSEIGASLSSFDRRQRDAAPVLGIKLELL